MNKNIQLSLKTAGIIALVAAAFTATPSSAALIVGGITSNAASDKSYDQWLGWQFKTGNATISVDRLGYYDITGSSDLNSTHEVRLYESVYVGPGTSSSRGWNVMSSLVATATVLPNSFWDQNYRWQDISGGPVSLAANTYYFLMANAAGDNYAELTSGNTGSWTMNSALVTEVFNAPISGYTTVAPTSQADWFMSTTTPFIYNAANVSIVPEPPTWAMMLVGVGALALLRRRRA
jgi:hypothetical protein